MSDRDDEKRKKRRIPPNSKLLLPKNINEWNIRMVARGHVTCHSLVELLLSFVLQIWGGVRIWCMVHTRSVSKMRTVYKVSHYCYSHNVECVGRPKNLLTVYTSFCGNSVSAQVRCFSCFGKTRKYALDRTLYQSCSSQKDSINNYLGLSKQ